MAKTKRTTKTSNVIQFPASKMQRTAAASATLESLFDVVFAPLPENVEAEIRSLLPPPGITDALSQPEGWNPFAELMWNFANRDRGVEVDSFAQSEVDQSISYLDEDFGA